MIKFIIPLLMILIAGCSGSSDDLFTAQRRGEPINMPKIMDRINEFRKGAVVDYDFYELKENYEDYYGQNFELRGYILDTAYNRILFYADPFFQENYGFFFVELDNPLPKQTAPHEALRYLTVGDKITLIGVMNGLKTYTLKKKTIWVSLETYQINVRGDELQELPFIEAVAMFKDDEIHTRFPEWVSLKIYPGFSEPEEE
jgi:hypothetical protein